MNLKMAAKITAKDTEDAENADELWQFHPSSFRVFRVLRIVRGNFPRCF